VFAGIAPLAIGGALLLLPVLRQVPHEAAEQATGTTIGRGIALAAGLGLVQAAAETDAWWAIPAVVGGLLIGFVTLRRVLPSGALRLARGLPSTLVLRGVLTCAFFGAEAYLPLTLTRVHGGTAREVGIPLTVAALGWATGSWWQGHTQRARTQLVQIGFATVAVGLALLVVVAQPAVSLWVAVPIWTIAGTGMGLAMPVVSVLTIELSTPEAQGRNSAALQICDIVGSVVGIAAVGAIVTGLGLHRLSTAATLGDALLAAVAVTGVVIAPRIRPAAGE
jgi:predicted MFS family arabinose efflux permease